MSHILFASVSKSLLGSHHFSFSEEKHWKIYVKRIVVVVVAVVAAVVVVVVVAAAIVVVVVNCPALIFDIVYTVTTVIIVYLATCLYSPLSNFCTSLPSFPPFCPTV